MARVAVTVAVAAVAAVAVRAVWMIRRRCRFLPYVFGCYRTQVTRKASASHLN